MELLFYNVLNGKSIIKSFPNRKLLSVLPCYKNVLVETIIQKLLKTMHSYNVDIWKSWNPQSQTKNLIKFISWYKRIKY